MLLVHSRSYKDPLSTGYNPSTRNSTAKKCRLKDTEAEDCVRYALLWHLYVRRNMPSHLDLGAVTHDDALGKRPQRLSANRRRRLESLATRSSAPGFLSDVSSIVEYGDNVVGGIATTYSELPSSGTLYVVKKAASLRIVSVHGIS